jgi:Cytochrome P450
MIIEVGDQRVETHPPEKLLDLPRWLFNDSPHFLSHCNVGPALALVFIGLQQVKPLIMRARSYPLPGLEPIEPVHKQNVFSSYLDGATLGGAVTAQPATTFYLLSLYPGTAQQVRAEFARVAGGAALRPEHVDALAFTKQVIQEAMRLYRPAALLSRQASRAVRIGGEEIAPGTLVYVPIYAVHRHRAYWDMPNDFDPSRFAPEVIKARDRFTYLPFGAGPRACIGMIFAQMEAAAVLAVLLPSLSLRLRPGYVPEPKLRVTLRPAEGMPMRVGRAV